jgi:hypothetical protein
MGRGGHGAEELGQWGCEVAKAPGVEPEVLVGAEGSVGVQQRRAIGEGGEKGFVDGQAVAHVIDEVARLGVGRCAAEGLLGDGQ